MKQSVIHGVLDQKAQLKRTFTRNTEGQHLQLADKLCIIDMRSRGVTKKAIKDQFNISHRTIGRIEAVKDRPLSMDKNNVILSLQRCNARKYPETEECVIEFAISMRLIRKRTRMTAESLNINSFEGFTELTGKISMSIFCPTIVQAARKRKQSASRKSSSSNRRDTADCN